MQRHEVMTRVSTSRQHYTRIHSQTGHFPFGRGFRTGLEVLIESKVSFDLNNVSLNADRKLQAECELRSTTTKSIIESKARKTLYAGVGTAERVDRIRGRPAVWTQKASVLGFSMSVVIGRN